MSKLDDIQKELAACRLERAGLRRSLEVIGQRIEELEQQQDMMEQAIAIVGSTVDARRVGATAINSALRLNQTA